MRILKLDANYKPLSFISDRQVVRLIVNDKVDIISFWDEDFFGSMKKPAIIRLKSYIRKRPVVPRFNYKAVFKRDLYKCQYTGELLSASQLTIDHVIPKSRGGESSWQNCVTASKDINSVKGNKTPEEAGLKLLGAPNYPQDPVSLEFRVMKEVHDDWKCYFPNIKR